MKVLIDTCIWSNALRHKDSDMDVTAKLQSIIQDGRIVIIGPIRQELLSGISREKQFESIKEYLSALKIFNYVKDIL